MSDDLLIDEPPVRRRFYSRWFGRAGGLQRSRFWRVLKWSGIVLLLIALICYAVAANLARPVQSTYGALPTMLWIEIAAIAWSLPGGVYGLATSSFSSLVIAGSGMGTRSGLWQSQQAWLTGEVPLGDELPDRFHISPSTPICAALAASSTDIHPTTAARSKIA